tara:strand:+ start:262 stop:564 length:303 start_codon:yes stop_codon:yes gene_type:complete
MLFGQVVDFTDLPSAMVQWDGIAEEIEEVQYMEGRGRGKKRRRITSTVKQYIGRVERYKNRAKGGADYDAWVTLSEDVEHEYNAMLATKDVLRSELDNVW